jgi:hypothetical protein
VVYASVYVPPAAAPTSTRREGHSQQGLELRSNAPA